LSRLFWTLSQKVFYFLFRIFQKNRLKNITTISFYCFSLEEQPQLQFLDQHQHGGQQPQQRHGTGTTLRFVDSIVFELSFIFFSNDLLPIPLTPLHQFVNYDQ
jgi:hypothetical protein